MDNSAEDCVLLVQVRSVPETNEELTAIGVGASVRHRQDTFVSVRVPNLLVFEFLSVDRHSASSVPSSSVTALHHEVLDDTVELIALVVLTFTTILAGAKTSEVFTGLGHICE